MQKKVQWTHVDLELLINIFVLCPGIIKWVLGDHTDFWMSFLTRDTMESATSYKQAKDWLSNKKLLAPAYFILGGNETAEVIAAYCIVCIVLYCIYLALHTNQKRFQRERPRGKRAVGCHPSVVD